MVGVIIDLRNTFNTIHHSFLISKLQDYGIRGYVIKKLFRWQTTICASVSLRRLNVKSHKGRYWAQNFLFKNEWDPLNVQNIEVFFCSQMTQIFFAVGMI